MCNVKSKAPTGVVRRPARRVQARLPCLNDSFLERGIRNNEARANTMNKGEFKNLISKENIAVPATDGFRLAATLFRAPHEDAPLVIIAAATAVKRGYYEKFARFLAQKGFQALTFDYRGIGAIHGRRVLRDSRLKCTSGVSWIWPGSSIGPREFLRRRRFYTLATVWPDRFFRWRTIIIV